jgi:hypothetical protein
MARDGLIVAAERLEPGDAPVDGGAEQLSLLGEADAPLPLAPAVPLPRGKSGPKGGRPAGSLNKSTKAWLDYLSARYRSPLVGLCEIYSRDVGDLARELGLFLVGEDGRPVMGADDQPMLAAGAKLDAFKAQVAAMIAALPYWHSKMPIALQVEAKTAGVVVFQTDAQLLQGASDVVGDFGLNIVEHQPLSAALSGKSEGDKSEDGMKALETNGLCDAGN